MKKYIALALTAAVAVLALAACGDSSSSSSSQPASSGVVSSSAVQSQVVPTGLDGIVADLAAAAELGDTFEVRQTDLELLGGLDGANIVAMSGVESVNSMENGGIVVVLEVVDGSAETVIPQMEAYREARMGNSDYGEYAAARDNTQNARIAAYGNYVVYAVSAAGTPEGWTALDNAIATAFA